MRLPCRRPSLPRLLCRRQFAPYNSGGLTPTMYDGRCASESWTAGNFARVSQWTLPLFSLRLPCYNKWEVR